MKLKNNYKIFFILSQLLCSFLVASCVSQTKAPTVSQDDRSQDQVLAMFEQGNQLMDAKDYRGAIKVFDQARIDQPASTLEGLLLFNSALSYQMLGECKPAYDKMRAVVRFNYKQNPRLAVSAKYKMAESLSCLGLDNKAIVLMVEIYRQRHLLPAATGQAELPARLAAMYARVDQQVMAKKYLAVAEKGLQQMGSNLKVLAETLFLMGDFSKITGDQAGWKKNMTSYSIYKKYLIRSAVLNQEDWSQRAFVGIQKAIDQMWSDYESLAINSQAKDAVLEKRRVNLEKQELLKAMLSQMIQSKLLVTPEAKPNKIKQELLSYFVKEEAKVRNVAASISSGPETTTEADKLNSIKREGRIREKPATPEALPSKSTEP